MSKNLGSVNEQIKNILENVKFKTIINGIFKRYTYLSRHDRQSAIYQGIWNFVKKPYKEDMDCEESSYFYSCLKWELGKEIKRLRKINYLQDSGDFIINLSSEILKGVDLRNSTNHHKKLDGQLLEIKEIAEKYVGQSTWKMVDMKYLGGYTLEEISKETGNSIEYVNKRIANGIKTIREHCYD